MIKFKLLLLFLSMQFIYPQLYAQGDFAYKIRVDEVDFLAPTQSPASKINIIRDYDPNPIVSGPAWKYPDVQKPVGFVSRTTVRVTAKFDLGDCKGTVWVKGDGPGSFDAPVQMLNQAGAYAPMDLGATFPVHKVEFYDPFVIKWYMSSSENGPWKEAGESKNPLYIIYSEDPSSLAGLQVYHSLIYYGCKNGNGGTVPENIVEAMYNGTFTNLSVPRRDNPTKPKMSYWTWPDPDQNADDQCYFYTQDLLKWENGRCGAWANFFKDMINVQGISGAEISVVFYEPDASTFIAKYESDLSAFFGSSASNVTFVVPQNGIIIPKFFVNNYQLNQNKFYVWNKEWAPFPQPNTPYTLPNGNILSFSPQDGAKAQGNDNPMSTFGDHGIVKYNNKYFDPSYGTAIVSSKNSYENASLAAFGLAQYLYYEYNPGQYIAIMWVNEFNQILVLQSTIQP